MTVVEEAPVRPAPRTQRRQIAGWVLTALAAVFVVVSMVAPQAAGVLGVPSAYIRIPAEALLGAGLLLVLPWRVGRVVAVLAGVVLGLVTVLRLLDLGFGTFLARPFDPLRDWSYFAAGASFLDQAMGRTATVGIGIAIVVLALAIVVLTPLAVLRVSRLVPGHRSLVTRLVAVLTVVWVGCLALGAEIVPGEPVASRSAGAIAVNRVLGISADLAEQEVFTAALADDPYADVPADQLLSGLAGRDVVLTFVESYGRVAVEDPELAGGVQELLDDGTQRLGAAGYSARSGFLTSPIAGGGSWLAHGTFLSGVRIPDQPRHDQLEASDRRTLTGMFGEAGWRTLGIMPGVGAEWPEAEFYGYDQLYPAADLGYRGPNFSWSSMPDQFTMQAFQDLEHGVADRGPLMAEIPLTSSHSPWRPVPQMLDWNALGDGSVYGPQAVGGGHPADILTSDPADVRAGYFATIEYSLETVVSWVETYGDDDLVLVFLGDHQPAPVVTGETSNRDVPITVVTRDQEVLDRIADWGWDEGLRPGPDAPVWPMEDFRDRFLQAYGPG